MKRKPRIYVLTNNHFDLTWRRCWDCRFTFKGHSFASYAEIEDYYMTDNLALARRFPEYKFEAESTAVVRKYLDRHPDRSETLRDLAAAGRFAVSGAGDNIVDANMVLGESIVRNFLTGLLWVEDHLGVRVRRGVRNDGFGNSAQVPQIFRGCEIRWVTGIGYSPIRGTYWRGLDGSVIYTGSIPTVGVGGGVEKYPPCPACRGKGCRKCRQTGYHGRTGLFELMTLTDATREKIMARAPVDQILHAAQGEGLRLLREDGWLKVRQGITTPEEVIRCTKI